MTKSFREFFEEQTSSETTKTSYSSKKLVEESFNSSDVNNAVNLIVRIFQKRMHEKLYLEKIPQQFKNKRGIFSGYRFFIGENGKAARFNFKTDVANMTSTDVESVDYWKEIGSNSPDIHIDLGGLNINQCIEKISNILLKPEIGSSVDVIGYSLNNKSNPYANMPIPPEFKEESISHSRKVIEEAAVMYGGKQFKTKSEACLYGVSELALSPAEVDAQLGLKKGATKFYAQRAGLIGTIEVEKGAPEQQMSVQYSMKYEEKLPDYADPEVVFDDIEDLASMVVSGISKSLLIIGQAGIGKSFGVNQVIEKAGLRRPQDWIYNKGTKITAAYLFRELWNCRNGKLLVFDDSDSVFDDAAALNMLKSALDSNDPRQISWKVKSNTLFAPETYGMSPDDFNDQAFDEWNDEVQSRVEAEHLPNEFIFGGRIIFISNMTKAQLMKSPDMKAILSRSFTIDVSLRMIDTFKRIETLVNKGVWNRDFTQEVQRDVLEYYREKAEASPDSMANSINIRTFIESGCRIASSGLPRWRGLLERYGSTFN